MPRKRKNSTESFADWMARVDHQVENAARKIKTGPRTPARPLIQNGSMPLAVFEGATLSPELRERLARLTALRQKSVIAWAELRQQRDRWRKLRDELVRIDEWLHDECAHICRELNPEQRL
jgi:hypothetical protein